MDMSGEIKWASGAKRNGSASPFQIAVYFRYKQTWGPSETDTHVHSDWQFASVSNGLVIPFLVGNVVQGRSSWGSQMVGSRVFCV